jgi:amino acid adenylation domain-containing protein
MTSPPTICNLVDRSIRDHPDRPAVVGPDGTIASYADLDARVRRFVVALQDAGVRRGDRVGVCRWKAIDTVAGFIAIMRCGAAYVPVDPASPPARNRAIFEDCDVRAILLDDRTAASIEGVPNAARIVGLPEVAGSPAEPESPTPEELAYILYTSGSTGRPKGVCLEHRHATTFVDWCVRTFECGPDDRCSSHAPFHFDLSILDLWMPLAAGGSVALVEESLAKDPRGLPGFIAERGITIWYSVPSILGLMAVHGRLDEHPHDRLRIVCFAGEVFPLPGLRALRAAWPTPDFWNLYGPTETNVCTAFRLPPVIDETRTEPFPIGSACDHCEIRLVDDAGRDVAHGETGRIVCRGGPVMRTYWGRTPEEIESFVELDGARWYDTGDLGSIDDAGDIVFHGRRDRMVKRHGYRIELGEIEAGLDRCDGLAECAVWATSDAGATIIHAAVVPEPGGTLSIIGLRGHCGRALPPYMSPDRFHVLDALPRTSTGKIDYRGLADPAG